MIKFFKVLSIFTSLASIEASNKSSISKFINASQTDQPLKLFACHHSDPQTFNFKETVASVCLDFNSAADALSESLKLRGLERNTLHCERTEKCKERVPTIPSNKVTISNLTFHDVGFYVLTHNGASWYYFEFWMQLIPRDVEIDIALIADKCENSAHSNSGPLTSIYLLDEDRACMDRTHMLASEYHRKNPNIKLRIIRVTWDSRLKSKVSLSCKSTVGAARFFKAVPHKKYYFKMDMDAILFPMRLLNFLITLDSTAVPGLPIHFGHALPFPHIFRQGHPDHTDRSNQAYYCQGGSGYGFNNVAMTRLALSTSNCTLHTWNEDTHISCRYHHLFPATGRIINCQNFHQFDVKFGGLDNISRRNTMIVLHGFKDDGSMMEPYRTAIINAYHKVQY